MADRKSVGFRYILTLFKQIQATASMSRMRHVSQTRSTQPTLPNVGVDEGSDKFAVFVQKALVSF